MKKICLRCFQLASLAGLLAACARIERPATAVQTEKSDTAAAAVREVKSRFAPDHHTAVFNIVAETEGKRALLNGETDNPAAKDAVIAAVARAGYEVNDKIAVLPAPELGETTSGISCLSVASGREQPGHGAELGTQILMGHPLAVLKQSNGWFLVRSEDRYLSWVQRGAFVRCAKDRVDAWNNSPRLIVTAFEDRIVETPQPDSLPVSDVVPGCLVKKTGEAGEWFKVELPDQRSGYLPKTSAVDYEEWKRTRQPTADAIERTAKTFLGRPYLWGGNSPKGLDCSGFTKLVYFLNGVELDRNASHQAQQGIDVPLDADLSHLKKGDLIFFGSRRRTERGRSVTHVGIYLGDKLFIHSSEFVRINSLDPESPLGDERRIRTLIIARRILP